MNIRKSWWLLINYLTVCALFFITHNTEAQIEHWNYVVANELHNSPRALPYSDNLGLTIHCAPFYNTWAEGGYLAGYNGEEWIMLSDSLSGTIFSAVDYEEGILLCGFGYIGTHLTAGVAYYDGNNWSYPWDFNNDVMNLIWANVPSLPLEVLQK